MTTQLILQLIIDTLSTSMMIMPTVSVLSYWKQRAELDTNQVTDNPHIIAARITALFKSTGVAITHLDINAVLAHQNILITAGELKELLGLTSQTYSLMDSLSLVKSLFPRYKSTDKAGVWAIYKFTNLITNTTYVGSSINFGNRLHTEYLKTHHKDHLRKILADIKTYDISNYTLEVTVFPVHLRELRLLLALEQYYLLHGPECNTLLVAAGSPGGLAVADRNRELHREPVFLYKDGIEVAHFLSKKEGPLSAANVLGTSQQYIQKCIATKSLFYNVFLLTDVPIPDSERQYMPLDDLKNMIELAYISVKAEQAVVTRSRVPVHLISTIDNTVHEFPSVGKAALWLSNHANVKVDKKYLKKHFLSQLPLHGYTVLYPNHTSS